MSARIWGKSSHVQIYEATGLCEAESEAKGIEKLQHEDAAAQR